MFAVFANFRLLDDLRLLEVCFSVVLTRWEVVKQKGEK